MSIRVAINGFGRMGRLALRAALHAPQFSVVHINECAGDAKTAAHLLRYDSVHGIWDTSINAGDDYIDVAHQRISYSRNTEITATAWRELNIDIVLECTGAFKTRAALAPYFDAGVKKVVVSAPMKESEGAPNIVMGVNQDCYLPTEHNIVTAASCTTNCLAPVVDVIHREFGIKHGCITTIHDVTNTQCIVDEYHKDWRRARACGSSLIPTSTGSATAITAIFPELKGRLNGIAVRVPLTNASLTDCVFEVETPTTIEAVNNALAQAADSRLKGILGYSTLPLVSVDYTNNTHSGIVDSLSTMVINDTQVKLLVWYDNEMGYVHRMTELVAKIAQTLPTP